MALKASVKKLTTELTGSIKANNQNTNNKVFKMKLLIRRDQKSGAFTGKSKFFLHVRAEVTKEESALIRKCGLGGEQLAYHEKKPNSSPEGAVGSVLKMMSDTLLTTNKLIEGTEFSCKNVAELVELEEQVKFSALKLKRHLEVARTFGGEEVIDIDELEMSAD